MDIRRAKTLYGQRIHRTDISGAAGRGVPDGYTQRNPHDDFIEPTAGSGLLTFCNYTVYAFEPETAGNLDRWNDDEREQGSCGRCKLAVQRLAE